MLSNKKIIFISILILGIFFGFYHLEFGLPKSFRADETEIVEPAIFYTYQAKDIIKNNNFYKLIPTSYVYGSFPTYLFTGYMMGVSKMHNLLDWEFSKFDMYLSVRIIFTLMFLGVSLILSSLYKKMYPNTLGYLWLLFFLLTNWKLIVHAHYANPDLLITFLFTFAVFFFYKYYKEENTSISLWISSVLLAMAVSTKITVLISLPLFLIVFISKKRLLDFIGLCLVIIMVFIVTNPFAIIFKYDFLLRLLEMLSKESSVVLDSVDTSYFKYISSMINISTIPLFLLAIVGIYNSINRRIEFPFHLFLMGNIVVYMLFFSLGDRKVERWLLPILPLFLLYSVIGIEKIHEYLKGKKFTLLSLIVVFSCLYLPLLLLTQFRRHVPKSEAYYWIKENLPPMSKIYVITEEGLDPINEIKGSEVSQLPLYASEGAQFFKPKNPHEYKYIVLSSRPMENYKKEYIKNVFPFYFENMSYFETTITKNEDFRLIKSFVLTKPNLIPLSDVFIYENISFTNNL